MTYSEAVSRLEDANIETSLTTIDSHPASILFFNEVAGQWRVFCDILPDGTLDTIAIQAVSDFTRE
jgi:hypothetical protein